MTFTFKREYRGPLRGVILDWAGTTVDFGCRAPAAVFIEVFRDRGITVTQSEAREPMGMAKREHIRQITLMPSVAEQWEKKFGKPATDADIDAIYEDFIPRQIACLKSYSDVIGGVPAFIDDCRNRGMKIGATTGYNREMMEICGEHASTQGYAPDVSICADDVPAGRPAPWMALMAAMKLGVYPMESIVKIGDTYADIDEGLNAGMWTIGISRSGNELGLSEQEVLDLTYAELAPRLHSIESKMRQRGAHFVARSVGECMPIIETINARLARGEQP